MEYAEYESILAKLHEVAADDMSAFYGRLRVLRDRAGVPLASRPGKGARRQFTEVDLWETHLALRLAEAGFPPHRIGLFFGQWVRPENVLQQVREYGPAGFTPTDLYMVISTHLNVGKGSETEGVKHAHVMLQSSELQTHFALKRTSHVLFFINISKLTSEIWEL